MESWDKTILKNVCKVNPKKIDTNGLPDDLEVSFFRWLLFLKYMEKSPNLKPDYSKDVKNGFTNFSEGEMSYSPKLHHAWKTAKSAIIGKLVNGIGYGTTEFYVLRCTKISSNESLISYGSDIISQ